MGQGEKIEKERYFFLPFYLSALATQNCVLCGVLIIISISISSSTFLSLTLSAHTKLLSLNKNKSVCKLRDFITRNNI